MPTELTISDVDRVRKKLPDDPPVDVTDDTILEALEAAHIDFVDRVAPKSVSIDDLRDVEVESILAAILVRHDIPGLSEEQGSRTESLIELSDRMIKSKIGGVAGVTPTAPNTLPVGPGGRDDAGIVQYKIFDAPKPATDEYEGKNADSDLGRPGPYN